MGLVKGVKEVKPSGPGEHHIAKVPNERIGTVIQGSGKHSFETSLGVNRGHILRSSRVMLRESVYILRKMGSHCGILS